MKTKAVFYKRNGSLHPAQEEGRDVLKALSDGQHVMVSIHTARFPKHHALFFALLTSVVKSGAWDGTVESLRIWLLMHLGYVDNIRFSDSNQPIIKVQSISFESMPQDKFDPLFAAAMKLIVDKLLAGDGYAELREEIETTLYS